MQLEHEEKKLKGLINGALAQHLYFLQNIRKEEEAVNHDNARFQNGIKDLKKKISNLKKKRKKAELNLQSQTRKYEDLMEDNVAAQQNLKEMYKKVAISRDDISMREVEASHDIMALEGLDSNIGEQISKVKKDIADLKSAMDSWSLMSQKKIEVCEGSKDKCFNSFDDWSKIWPGVRSWLDTESVSLNSTKTSASLQRFIGEWKGLRSIAIAIKSLNTAMETKAKEGEGDPSQPPYDYNIPLNKLKDKLTEQLKSNRQTINTTSQETKKLDNLRKRMNSLLVSLCNALEKDMTESMRDANRQAAKSLHAQTVSIDSAPASVPNVGERDSLFEDSGIGGTTGLDANSSIINATAALVDDTSMASTISGGHIKKLVENVTAKQFIPGMHVKHWLQHTAIRGDYVSTGDADGTSGMGDVSVGMNIASTGTYPVYASNTLNSHGPRDVLLNTRSTDDRVRLAKGVAHAEDTATIRVLLGLPAEEESHHITNSTSSFSHANMIAVLASLECRKAFDDIEWAMEKYKATMSKQFMQQLAEDGKKPSSGVGVDGASIAKLSTSEKQQAFRLIEEANKHDLEVQFDSFHAWLSYQIIGKQLSLSINEPFPSPIDWLIKQTTSASDVLNTREFVPGARANAINSSVPPKPVHNAANKEAAEMAATKFKLLHPPPKDAPVNAFTGRRKPPSMLVPTTKKLYSGSEMDDRDEDDEEAGDTVGSLAELSCSSNGSKQSMQRGESIRQSIHRALMDDTDDETNGTQDRILLQKTIHLPGCQKETLIVSIYYQVEFERLRLHVVNINGSEGYTMLITQQDIQNIFIDKADLKYTNITNAHICTELLRLIKIEKMSKTNAHTLFTAAKSVGFKKASLLIEASGTQQTDILMEEDTCKVLMLHNSRKDLTLCAICKFRVAHIDSVVKHFPKRDAHVGSVEHMLNKTEKAPVMHARSTVF